MEGEREGREERGRSWRRGRREGGEGREREEREESEGGSTPRAFHYRLFDSLEGKSGGFVGKRQETDGHEDNKGH